jgi:hypothetical protein
MDLRFCVCWLVECCARMSSMVFATMQTARTCTRETLTGKMIARAKVAMSGVKARLGRLFYRRRVSRSLPASPRCAGSTWRNGQSSHPIRLQKWWVSLFLGLGAQRDVE